MTSQPLHGAFNARPTPPPARRRDDMKGQYRTMLALGAVSAVLLLLGLTNFVLATQPWAHTGVRAEVTGVFAYDRGTGEVSGGARDSFTQGHAFAARVDWAALPSDLTVGAIWYDSNETGVGGIAQGPAGDFAARHQTVPMINTEAPPGTYTVLVMHYVNRQPVEVLGRKSVRITPR